MRRDRIAAVAFAATIVVAIVAATPGTASAQAPGDVRTTLYQIRNVSLDSAATVAVSICEAAWRIARTGGGTAEIVCDVDRLSRERSLVVSTTDELHASIAARLAEFDRSPDTKAFHVIVLSAGTQTGGTDPDIPDGARQALADFAEFMPYSSFRVLGSGFLRTSQRAQTTLPGPEEFFVGIEFRPVADPTVPFLVEDFNISQMTATTYTNSGEVARDAYHRQVLQTTFTIEPGETVVVGTSKLDGDDDAVVVLLTAIRN